MKLISLAYELRKLLADGRELNSFQIYAALEAKVPPEIAVRTFDRDYVHPENYPMSERVWKGARLYINARLHKEACPRGFLLKRRQNGTHFWKLKRRREP